MSALARFLLVAFAVAVNSPNANAQVRAPTVILVHGAFADASCWQLVIPILQLGGYRVIAVQIPLTSFDADVETTRRVIDGLSGPVVLVGHAYGGAVITAAAAGNQNVKALVYIAALAPKEGEPIGALAMRYPNALNQSLQVDAAGFLWTDQAKYQAVFAADLSMTEARVSAATQKPIHRDVFTATLDRVAWKTVPSWYLIAQNDMALNPDLQRFYAKRIGATAVEIMSSHAAFMSQPIAVTKLIAEAATSARE